MSKLTEFWDRVMLAQKEREEKGSGYVEIVSYGGTAVYRSVTEIMNGFTSWVCWEPFHVLRHFSYIDDSESTVEWKENA